MQESDDTIMRVHVLVRQDLGMTKGKICAQVAHAVLGLYKDIMDKDPVAFAQWASLNFAQQTYIANSQQQLYEAQTAAQSIGTNAYTVHDAGRTQIAPMTPTVCAIGPATDKQVRAILIEKGHTILD